MAEMKIMNNIFEVRVNPDNIYINPNTILNYVDTQNFYLNIKQRELVDQIIRHLSELNTEADGHIESNDDDVESDDYYIEPNEYVLIESKNCNIKLSFCSVHSIGVTLDDETTPVFAKIEIIDSESNEIICELDTSNVCSVREFFELFVQNMPNYGFMPK